MRNISFFFELFMCAHNILASIIKLLVLFGQLDLFILQWEEVLCSGFDLAVLDPSDRKGTDTYVSLLGIHICHNR